MRTCRLLIAGGTPATLGDLSRWGATATRMSDSRMPIGDFKLKNPCLLLAGTFDNRQWGYAGAQESDKSTQGMADRSLAFFHGTELRGACRNNDA